MKIQIFHVKFKILFKIYSRQENQIEENNNSNENKEEEEYSSLNNQNEATEIELSEINTGQLEAISKDRIQKIISDEENEDNNKSPHSPSNISREITEPRTVIRRQFEKSDASVQFESTDDSILATLINSPRFELDAKADSVPR